MRQRPKQIKAFTLIELLVVLVILGCLIGLALPSTTNNHARAVQGEAERLAALIGVLSEEAILDNREYGLQLSEQNYRVLRYNERQALWQTVADHPLPAFSRLHFSLEGQSLKLAAEQQNASHQAPADAAVSLMPQLLILSNGELSAFNLRIEERAADGAVFTLASNGFDLPQAEWATR
jgi:general secretion pathway protein H